MLADQSDYKVAMCAHCNKVDTCPDMNFDVAGSYNSINQSDASWVFVAQDQVLADQSVSCHVRTLQQVDTCPDMNLDVAGSYNSINQSYASWVFVAQVKCDVYFRYEYNWMIFQFTTTALVGVRRRSSQ